MPLTTNSSSKRSKKSPKGKQSTSPCTTSSPIRGKSHLRHCGPGIASWCKPQHPCSSPRPLYPSSILQTPVCPLVVPVWLLRRGLHGGKFTWCFLERSGRYASFSLKDGFIIWAWVRDSTFVILGIEPGALCMLGKPAL